MTVLPLVAQVGMLPIERAAVRDCKEEVEMLFPFTNPIPNVRNWSIDGVISYAKIQAKKPLVSSLLLLCFTGTKCCLTVMISLFKCYDQGLLIHDNAFTVRFRTYLCVLFSWCPNLV